MQLYGIHTADKDLNFLKRINEDLQSIYKPTYKYLRLEADYKTHEECLLTLRGSNKATLFFFCHALENSIRGCNIDYATSSKSYKSFSYGNLISPTKNIDIFNQKKVFCLACNSRDLGGHAIKAGARVFLGFGDVPFLVTENYKEQAVIDLVKAELGKILFAQLTDCIDKNKTFNTLSSQILLGIDQARNKLLSNKEAGVGIRKEVYRVLSKIKNGITMYGDGELTLL